MVCGFEVEEGKLVPMEVTIGLLKAAMQAAPVKSFLIDGFPRALDQAGGLLRTNTPPTLNR